MRKALVLALMLSFTLAAPASAGVRHVQCRYQSVEPGKWTPDEVRWTIRCASDHFNVDYRYAMYVAQRESHLQATARNPYSGACGIFQHMPAYFEGRLQAVPDHFRRWRDSCFNARSNILAALWMAHRYGWGAWGG